MAVPGHPRSLILAPIDSVYATSYWSSIGTLVLPCPISEFWGVPLGLDCQCVAPRSEDPKLIIRVNNFELTQHICPWYINVTDRQADRQLMIAIPH